MITDRYKLLFYIIIAIISFNLIKCDDEVASTAEKILQPQEGFEARSAFNPRVDYNEWKPVGRGDPLKNDPTYDYSPPVLDRVRYWADNNANSNYSEKKNKSDILILGVASKRQSSHKKESKYPSIRRSYYSHQLPTRLMPPPMQTMSPSSSKPSTTESYTYYQPSKTYYSTQSWSNNKHYDNHYDESVNYVSITRPDLPKPNYLRSSLNDIKQNIPSRKPWVQDLLKKEVVQRPITKRPITTTTEYPKVPPKSVFETFPTTEATTSPVFFTTTAQKSTTSQIPTTTQSTFLPTIAPIDITTESTYTQNKHGRPLLGPMYLIIEGHSKVKTYGLNDNETFHMPKIVPVSPTQEAVIIEHLVSNDNRGQAMQVMHLHKKTSTTTQSPEIPTKQESEVLNNNEEPSRMDSLLSLLDSSLGSFFLNDLNENNTNSKVTDLERILDDAIKHENALKNNISTTTSAPTTTIDPREKRQIFDYDQLPESRFKEIINDDYEDNYSDELTELSSQEKTLYRSTNSESSETFDEIDRT